MFKKRYLTIAIIISVIIFSVIVINRSNGTPDETAKCIGQNSELYIQLGCHACESQEKLFGESYQYLNTIDCFYEEERNKCITAEITATPTWIIDGKKYVGVQSIEELKKLTGC